MKTLVALTFLMMFVVSCGGGAESLATDTRTGANSNPAAFETPPAPGSK